MGEEENTYYENYLPINPETASAEELSSNFEKRTIIVE
jgi:hypothetical protein